MTVRYFSVKNKNDLHRCGETFLAETKNPSIIPRKKETILINDTMYKVYDICYCTDYKSDYIDEIYIPIIDITLIEVEIAE